jgi:hypothetical protein
MATVSPNIQLETALTQFAAEPSVSADQAAQLRAAVTENAVMLSKLNQYAQAGHLSGFAVEAQGTKPNLVGIYDLQTGVVTLPAASFQATGVIPSTDLKTNLKLQQILTEFGHSSVLDPATGTTKTVSKNMLDNLQSSLNGSPALAKEFKLAVNANPPLLEHFALLPPSTGAGGSYNDRTNTMNILPRTIETNSQGSPLGVFNINDMTFVLGHEIQHGVNAAEKEAARQTFIAQVSAIAVSNNPIHDYTTAIDHIIKAGRSDEAKAEIAGWNAVLSHVQQTNSTATITDMYALPNQTPRIRDFIDINTATGTAFAKAGLAFNPDATLSNTANNIEAMGVHYFDKAPSLSKIGPNADNDYQNFYGTNAIANVIHQERSQNHLVNGFAPQIHINMSQLRLQEPLIESFGLQITINPNTPQRYYNSGNQPPSIEKFDHTSNGINAFQHVPTTAASNNQMLNVEATSIQAPAMKVGQPCAKNDDEQTPAIEAPKPKQNHQPEISAPIGGPPIAAVNASDRADRGDDKRDDKQVVGVTTGLQLGNDFREKGHPGNGAYEKMLDEVQRMETTNGIAHGPNSALVAAALMVKAEQNKFYTAAIVRMEPDGQVSTLKLNPFGPSPKISVDPKEMVAQGQSFEKSTEQWALARSRQYASDAPAAERTLYQVKAMAQMTPTDQGLFEKIRQNVPSHISDDVVAKTMLQAKKEGVSNADQVDTVAMMGDNITLKGRTPGTRSTTDVNEPAAPMAETAKQTESFNQQLAIDLRLQQEQAFARKQEQENQSATQKMGGGMAMG